MTTQARTPGLAEETIAQDEAVHTTDFIAFLQKTSEKRQREERQQAPGAPMRRFNQPRHTACVTGTFTVLDGLAAEHRIGLFAQPRTYSAWIRFANATSASDRERDVRGMSIQLSNVIGENLTPGATTQDFVLNSHPVMLSAGPKEFLELLEANEAGGLRRAFYLLTHPSVVRIGFRSRQHHSSHLEIPYWSTTPYLFGTGRAVKYLARPCTSRETPKPDPLTDRYLHDVMRAHLAHEDGCFDFMIQFQKDPERTPIEDATVEWREEDAPYVKVARIHIPAQDIDDAGRLQRCEEVGFNPWHCLPEHRPLGSFNRARREIYRAMAQFRHDRSR